MEHLFQLFTNSLIRRFPKYYSHLPAAHTQRIETVRGLSLGYISSGGSKIFERAAARNAGDRVFFFGKKAAAREGGEGEDLKTRKEFPSPRDISRCCTDRSVIFDWAARVRTPPSSSDPTPSTTPFAHPLPRSAQRNVG